jgi:hypothetical protein
MPKDIKKIETLVQDETDLNLKDLISNEDVGALKGMIGELKDTWNKKQIYRTETEARFSVLQDNRYPTKASKYWQCVREQAHFLDSLMTLSFEFREGQVKIKQIKQKLKTETDELKIELLKIKLDRQNFSQATRELDAKDRMRELKMWSKLKREFNDGSFDDKNVNSHQLESYHKMYAEKVKNINPNTTEPEAFNVIGQFQSLNRIVKTGELQYDEKKKISSDKPKS